MSDRTLGQIVDGLDIVPTFRDGDLVASAIVLLEVIEEDGSTRLCTAWPDDMNFLKRIGMLHTAIHLQTERVGPTRSRDEE